MKHFSPTGRRNYGRPLKRLLDTWVRNGSTSGLTPWQIYDDDDDDDDGDEQQTLALLHTKHDLIYPTYQIPVFAVQVNVTFLIDTYIQTQTTIN
jgi:hypothetical protein